MRFNDRTDAGRQLANALTEYDETQNLLILGIPRGGVEVAHAVAQQFKMPLSVIITKKIPYPGQPEAAIGAVSPDGRHSVDESWVDYEGISRRYIEEQVAGLKVEIKQAYKEYTGKVTPPSLKDKTIIIIDDGAATGHSVRVAAEYARRQGAKKVIVGLPIAPKEVQDMLEEIVDDVVVIHTPLVMYSVGEFYADFEQIEEKQVLAFLKK